MDFPLHRTDLETSTGVLFSTPGAAHGAAAGLLEGPDDHPPVERATEREDRLPRDGAGREGRGPRRGGGGW